MNALFSKPALLASSYEEWKWLKISISKTIDDLEKRMHDDATYIIKVKNLTCIDGLLPDEVKNNAQYAHTKKEFEKHFEILRKFNGNSPKKYKQKYSRESRAAKMHK